MSVTVTIGPDGYTAAVRASGHDFLADEPVSLGGADKGPSPYDLLLASLGACTLITLRMYAKRKGWAMTGAAVRLAHARVHAKDCQDCESAEGMVSRIERSITLKGDLSQEQRSRLLDIANKCPVHRTLAGEVKIDTSLEPGGTEATQ